MKLNRFSFAAIIFAFFSIFLSASFVRADEPFGAISLGSYKNLSNATQQIGDILDNPQLGMLFQAIDPVLGDEFLEGFDKTKPVGALLYADSKDKTKVYPLIFVPQKDSNSLTSRIGEYNEGVEIDEEFKEGDLTLTKVSFAAFPLFARSANGWTFLSTESKALVDIPENPEKLLGDMAGKYVLGLRFDFGKMPQEIKKLLLDQIKQGMDIAQTIQKMNANESDESEDSPKTLEERIQELSSSQQMSFEELKTLVDDSQIIVLGLGVNKAKETLFFEVYYEAKNGTEMGKAMTELAYAKPFANCLLPGAAFSVAQVQKNVPSAVKKIKDQLSKIKDLVFDGLKEQGITENVSDKKMDQAKKLADRSEKLLVKILDRSVSKNVQNGLAFFFQQDNISFVYGDPDCNTEEIDKLIKDWVAFAVPEDEGKDVINWDSETWEGLKFSTFTFSVDKIKEKLNDSDNDQAKAFAEWLEKAFGKSITIAYARSDKAFYFAAGKDSVDLIKKVVKNGSAEVPAGVQAYAELAVGQILATIAKLPMPEESFDESVRDQFTMVATAALGEDNADKILISGSYGKNSATTTIDLQKGIVRAINSLILIYSMNNM